MNFLILKKYNFNLEKAITAQKSSPLGYGSEFRPPQTLRKVFKHHPLWAQMEQLLINGSEWPLSDLSMSDKIEDLTEALAFGNHKGASQKSVLLKKLISDDIHYGYGLVIPRSTGKNLTSPKCMRSTNEHHETVHIRHRRRRCGKGASDRRSKFQMAVRIVGQQKGEEREPPMLHVRALSHVATVLDSGGKKKVPTSTDCTPEDQHQVSLQEVPSKRHHSNTDHHTSTQRQAGNHYAMSYLWGHPMPFQMKHTSGEHPRPGKQDPIRQQLGPTDQLHTKPTPCPIDQHY